VPGGDGPQNRVAILRVFAAGRRKGLERKAHRKRIGASEDLEQKARFFAVCEFSAQITKPQKMCLNSESQKRC
jgi:hypothetical protein